MATALRKLPDLPAFEAARERWQAARAAHRALHAKLEGAKAAYALAVIPADEDAPVSPRLTALAEAHLCGRRSSPARLTAEIAALEEEIADGADAYAAERRKWDFELGLEQQRRAEAMRPAMQEAAQRIARVVEKLSAEVVAARDLTAELTEVGVLTADIGHEFGVLSDYHSILSQWNRRMLQAGLL